MGARWPRSFQLSNPKTYQLFESLILWAGSYFSLQPLLTEEIPRVKPTKYDCSTSKMGCQISPAL